MHEAIIEQTDYLTLVQNLKGMYKILDEHGELVYTSWYFHRAKDRFYLLKSEVEKQCKTDNTSLS